MKKPIAVKRYFFVDESGDPTFYGRKKKLLLGTGLCAPYLMLGYVRTEQPELLREALSKLRAELSKEPLFTGIPSFAKTQSYFHAKNDAPEVRSEVFRLLRTLPLKGQFIFARKRLSTFQNAFYSNEGAFYDHLVTHLFKRSLHLAKENQIFFAKRCSKARQAPLIAAVNKAARSFSKLYGKPAPTITRVDCQSPIGEPCLQAVDYYLWAVQRVFTKGEDRFFRFIEEQIEVVWDLYDIGGYPKTFYTSRNPLRPNKISPL